MIVIRRRGRPHIVFAHGVWVWFHPGGSLPWPAWAKLDKFCARLNGG